MSVFWVRRLGLGLIPADEISDGLFEKLPFDKNIKVEATVPRNPEFHRLVFGLFGLLAKAFDENPEFVRHKLLVSIGEYREVDCGPIEITPEMIARGAAVLREMYAGAGNSADLIVVEILKAMIGERMIDRVPNSLSYAAMDDVRFKEMFEKLVKATYAIWGMLPADVKREVDLMLAPKAEKTR